MRRIMAILAIVLIPLAVFAAMIVADRTFGAPGRGYDYVVKVDLPGEDERAGLPKIEGPLDSSRPLVVIDAGHGGKDPGAGRGSLREKDLTLALALALRDDLLRKGGVRVALTRDDDRYIVLGERSAIARRLGADLFISIHADSTEEANGALGATVYTLSAKGSNQAAEKIAARENAVDLINGIHVRDQSDEVSAILVDLSQRETQAKSEEFGALILREGLGRIPFREKTGQSAAFAVLKAPDLPSVLFESGYINNPGDQARLTSAQGKQDFATVVGDAIRAFFARHSRLA
ncbi:MAG: N-acetylmuramoyl-L-alanine amidase [Novosphingobium sp.]|jgi:N-acetylmuramoyl-L-alanine amidase|uniref:N-acetylmuramoyl-L-alanine amidase family protein n=1 Tax=Novosphingobium sp. TaxID=1874826 RepID=UPI001D62EB1B|nr:N-acetylmuramoyl-L-alanine amidase [Novosphingobium sp.]MCB2058659.1 N-acetylmuramoyl-L-alanine amidase [Novosphingobium sp.]MCP5387906.1 N-acetylmuramoyl-L-alanine amidase [Novosphingobium sp.]